MTKQLRVRIALLLFTSASLFGTSAFAAADASKFQAMYLYHFQNTGLHYFTDTYEYNYQQGARFEKLSFFLLKKVNPSKDGRFLYFCSMDGNPNLRFLTLDPLCDGNTFEGQAGVLSMKKTTDTPDEIYLCSFTNNDSLLTTEKADCGDKAMIAMAGYGSKMLPLTPDAPLPSTQVQTYRYDSSYGHAMSTSEEEEFPSEVGYSYKKPSFKVFETQTETMQPIYRCWYARGNNRDYFVTTKSDCERTTSDGALGYVEKKPTSVSQYPIYRCYGGGFKHLITTDLSECKGYTVEMILGFVAK